MFRPRRLSNASILPKHRTPGILARSLSDGRAKSQSENPAIGLLEGTDRRTVGAALPELLGSIYCEFFVRKLNNGKANKPIRSRCPNANVNKIIIVKPSTNSASCGKYSFASNAYDLHPASSSQERLMPKIPATLVLVGNRRCQMICRECRIR